MGIWHDARLAACYAQLGNADACRRNLAKVYAAIPQYPLIWIAREQMPYKPAEDIEHLGLHTHNGIRKGLTPAFQKSIRSVSGYGAADVVCVACGKMPAIVLEITMFAPVGRSSAFAPIRSRRQQYDVHEPALYDGFDIDAEYRLARVQPPAREPRGIMERVADVAAAACVALLIIGFSMFMLDLPHQSSGPLTGSLADSQQANS